MVGVTQGLSDRGEFHRNASRESEHSSATKSNLSKRVEMVVEHALFWERLSTPWSWIARGQNHPLIVQPRQLSYSIHCQRMFPRNGRRLYRAPLTSSGRAFPRLAGDGEVRALTGRSRGSRPCDQPSECVCKPHLVGSPGSSDRRARRWWQRRQQCAAARVTSNIASEPQFRALRISSLGSE